jgi:predicted peptidase
VGITPYSADSDSENGDRVGLVAHVPAGYSDKDPARPLLIFLHGAAEAGDGSEAELQKVLAPGHGIPSIIAAGDWPSDLPFIVLMPQYSKVDSNHCELWDEIASVIDWAEATYAIDKTRIYLTGISCGAIGVLDYLSASDKLDANKVAATVPIASAPYASPSFDTVIGGCAIAKTPTWFFHGALDDVVPVHYVEDAVAELNTCTNPKPNDLKLTIYPDGGHDEKTWQVTYDGSAGNDIYSWLLGHRCSSCPA